MRKLSIVLVLLLFSLGALAQYEEAFAKASDYASQASKAYKQKNYASALELFQKAMDIYELKDSVDKPQVYFSAGVAAFKAKQYEKASGYFSVSGELGYNTEKSYKFQYMSLKKFATEEQMHEALVKAYENAPDVAMVQKLAANSYTKKGLEPYKEGAKIIQDAQPLLEAEKVEEYNAEAEKASVKFRKALPSMEKAVEINPEKQTALMALKEIYTVLEMEEKLKAVEEKLVQLEDQGGEEE